MSTRSAAGDEAFKDADLDEALKAEVTFAELQGLRYKASRQFFAHVSTGEKLVVLALCQEASRNLTAYWTRRARTLDRTIRNHLLDMVHEPSSPVHSSLQYLSSMMSSTSSASARLVLLWRPHADSYMEFCNRRPDLVRLMRKLVLATCAGIFRRHSCVFGRLSWALT